MKEPMQVGDSDGLDSLYTTPNKKGGDTVDEQERQEMNQTATIPVKVLQGKHPDAPKAGDEIVVKVREVNGDMAVIEYSETPASDIGEGEGDGYGEGPQNQSADEELEELGKKY